ncbi:hypothetical protein GGF32_004345 [Allomyces javanicus]|nr:hypothetical protein GGF32_004345 [Allomyces javanicus]
MRLPPLVCKLSIKGILLRSPDPFDFACFLPRNLKQLSLVECYNLEWDNDGTGDAWLTWAKFFDEGVPSTVTDLSVYVRYRGDPEKLADLAEQI